MNNIQSNNEKIPPSKAWDYQQRDLYDQACQEKKLKVQDHETLLQTLNRIELKLDILLMQKQK